MEAELKCPVCQQFYSNPVVLPCWHSVCSACVARIVKRPPVTSLTTAVVDLKIDYDDQFMDMAARNADGVNFRVRSSTQSMSNNGGVMRRLVSSASSTALAQIRQRRPPPIPPMRRASASFCGGPQGLDDVRNCSRRAEPGEFSGDSCAFSDSSSIASDTDSGVVCSKENVLPKRSGLWSSSGNLSYFGRSESGVESQVICPVCNHVLSFIGTRPLPILRPNHALAAIVRKYTSSAEKKHTVECQLCTDDKRRLAVVVCEQCNIAYCGECQNQCHPPRGPFATHRLVAPAVVNAQADSSIDCVTKCEEHPDEVLSLYCLSCSCGTCCLCAQSGRHFGHTVQALGALSRTRKVELSQILQRLSEKAKRGQEFLRSLKQMQGEIQANSVEFQSSVSSQLDNILQVLQVRRQQILAQVVDDRRRKEQSFASQISHGATHIQRTTGLLQISIEMLKDSDPLAFLEVADGLMQRASHAERQFEQVMTFEPAVAPTFSMQLNIDDVINAIYSMSLCGVEDSNAPQIISEECSKEQNEIIVSWRSASSPEDSSFIGYVLEVAHDSDKVFKEVYRGTSTICAVKDLASSTTYLARVKTIRASGGSRYSDCIRLQTEAESFSFDPTATSSDIMLSNGNMTARCGPHCCNTDYRVACCSIQLVAGRHYWQFVVDRFENNCDLAFGIAEPGVATDCLLGKDSKACSMYVDRNRSWFLQAGAHVNRVEGGILQGSTIGVLLDMERGTLSFFINGKPRGGIRDIKASVLQPAVGLNRHASVTLQSGLKASSVGSFCDGD